MGTSATETSNPVAITSGINATTFTLNRSNHKAVIVSSTKAVTIGPHTVGVAGSTITSSRTITNITTANQFASLTIIAAGTAETMTPYAIEATLFPNA